MYNHIGMVRACRSICRHRTFLPDTTLPHYHGSRGSWWITMSSSINSQNCLQPMQTTVVCSWSRIVVSKAGCSSIAIVTPAPSSEPPCHAGIVMEIQCLLIWSCRIPISIGIRQRGMLPLTIPLQSSAKCTSNIKTHRTTQSHSISMTVRSSRMDSPALMCTQATQQRCSRSLTRISAVSKFIPKNEVMVTLKLTLDNAWAWIGCTWVSLVTHNLGLMTHWKSRCQMGPYPWLVHFHPTLPVVASGFPISSSQDWLGWYGFIVLHGRGWRLDFGWRYFVALISKMAWMNGMHMMLRSVIFSFAWIITMIIFRKSVILVRTRGVSCYTMHRATGSRCWRWMELG